MRIKVKRVPKLLKQDSARILREEMEQATKQVGAAVASQVKVEIGASSPYPPIDTGVLRNGIAPVFTGPLRVSVAPSPVTDAYAVTQELGRRPGRPGPPLAPILSWVMRKFRKSKKEAMGMAVAVRKKLHDKGMVGRFFFREAREKTPKIAKDLVRAAVARWKRRVTQ